MSHLYFVAGLPRSGSALLMNLLKQNPNIHGETVSSLCAMVSTIHGVWDKLESNKIHYNLQSKIDVLRSVLDNYHNQYQKDIIFDKDRMWVSHIGLLEALYQKQVKMLIPVRNPAEILSSLEKIRKNNPLHLTLSDSELRENSSIASRAFYFAGPNGAMGSSYQVIKDAVTMGYLDRMLFVDYNRFCNSPKSQLKRIYDFFELPGFEHDFKNIQQTENYNDVLSMMPNSHKIKPSLEKTTVNCVEYLGLDLFQQYNREIFWDAWI